MYEKQTLLLPFCNMAGFFCGLLGVFSLLCLLLAFLTAILFPQCLFRMDLRPGKHFKYTPLFVFAAEMFS
jgi:hypothetical protein